MNLPVERWPTPPKGVDPHYADFRNFLSRVWEHLRIVPTELQFDLAWWMQHGPRDLVILCFRGFGKSWIASTFLVWRLLMDPGRRVLNTSGSRDKAYQCNTFMLRLIRELPELQHLFPGPNMRSSNIAFDVSGSPLHQAPSAASVGINSNYLNGARCSDYVGDDVETKKNSATEKQAATIMDMAIELGGSILMPELDIEDPWGCFLGTPQNERSLYFQLADRGYTVMIYPVLYPTEKEHQQYIVGGRDMLAPLINKRLNENPDLVGQPTEPIRFDHPEVFRRREKHGKHGFALQFMLFPNLDRDLQYPLKLEDWIVMDLDPEFGWEKVLYDRDNVIEDLPWVGFRGGRFRGHGGTAGKLVPYQRKVMAIDPSGGGADECAYVIGAVINAQVFLLAVGGFQAGNTEETYQGLAMLAEKWKVDKVVIEENWGDGMWGRVFRPYLRKIHPGCAVEDIRVHGVKEHRIIDYLDPLMDSHRLIVNRAAIQNDFDSTQEYPDEACGLDYQICYQASRLTRDKGCLAQDDRLDALALLVQYVSATMGRDWEREIERRKARDFDAQLKFWDRQRAQFDVNLRRGLERSKSKKSWINKRSRGSSRVW